MTRERLEGLALSLSLYEGGPQGVAFSSPPVAKKATSPLPRGDKASFLAPEMYKLQGGQQAASERGVENRKREQAPALQRFVYAAN